MLKASDPHKVLFSDLPEILNAESEVELVSKISSLTEELQNAYPEMLQKFKLLLYKALDHKGPISIIRDRANDIKGTAGDFQIDGFVANLSVYKDDSASLEALLATTIHKNPKDWVDRDQEAAINALGDICATFRRIETLGSLRGKSAKRNAFAFVYSDPKNSTVSDSFDISEDRLPALKKISKELLSDLKDKGLSKDEILAAFSQACSELIELDT
jgi:hypothetical protein